jgi:hypothetical protein
MAKSISQAQAEALAEGFFDSQATTLEGRDALRPKKSLSVLFRLAGELVEAAQSNLIKSNSIASGVLSDSLSVSSPVKIGNTVRVDVTMAYYGRFVNEGVNGVKKSRGSKFKFKYANPGRKMVAAIRGWQRRGGLSVRTVVKSRTGVIGKQEGKNKRISEMAAAYAIAKSIKMRGLKKTGFMDKAVATINAKAIEQLGAALKIDVINSLPNKL